MEPSFPITGQFQTEPLLCFLFGYCSPPGRRICFPTSVYQLIAQVFTTVIDGFGLWSFVAQGKGKRVVFHHVASGNLGDEMLARAFHWRDCLRIWWPSAKDGLLPLRKDSIEPVGYRRAFTTPLARSMLSPKRDGVSGSPQKCKEPTPRSANAQDPSYFRVVGAESGVVSRR
jgi:hypothetical protein